jgi:hypothetical protein
VRSAGAVKKMRVGNTSVWQSDMWSWLARGFLLCTTGVLVRTLCTPYRVRAVSTYLRIAARRAVRRPRTHAPVSALHDERGDDESPPASP